MNTDTNPSVGSYRPAVRRIMASGKGVLAERHDGALLTLPERGWCLLPCMSLMPPVTPALSAIQRSWRSKMNYTNKRGRAAAVTKGVHGSAGTRQQEERRR